VVDPTGTGAVVQPIVSPVSQTTYGQETYQFADFPMSMYPGVGPIFAARSVSVQWTQWQYSISFVSFSKYQALVRQYVSSFFAPPVIGCQFGQGTDGSFKLYPLADQNYQLTLDALCLPLPLLRPVAGSDPRPVHPRGAVLRRPLGASWPRLDVSAILATRHGLFQSQGRRPFRHVFAPRLRVHPTRPGQQLL